MTDCNCTSSSDGRDDANASEDYPVCSSGCGRPAVVRGIDVVEGEVVPDTPFCDECFTPASKVELPDGVDREGVVDSDSLIVTPADTVIQFDGETIIQHGPGEESRVVLG
jgi:hypothetical protein